MGNKEAKISCYADDAVLVVESEDDLQRLLYQFNKTTKKFNMVISAAKKSMTTSKHRSNASLWSTIKLYTKKGKLNI